MTSAAREGGIIGRQGPHAVQMVRQQHPAVNAERMGFPGVGNPVPKRGADRFITEERLSSKGHHGKKIGAALHIGPSVIRHRISPYNAAHTPKKIAHTRTSVYFIPPKP